MGNVLRSPAIDARRVHLHSGTPEEKQTAMFKAKQKIYLGPVMDPGDLPDEPIACVQACGCTPESRRVDRWRAGRGRAPSMLAIAPVPDGGLARLKILTLPLKRVTKKCDYAG